jgi:O-acetylhomoserine (thiol)-lyase
VHCIDRSVAPVSDEEALRNVMQTNTNRVFCESTGNPGLEISDIPGMSEIAHESVISVVVRSEGAEGHLPIYLRY